MRHKMSMCARRQLVWAQAKRYRNAKKEARGGCTRALLPGRPHADASSDGLLDVPAACGSSGNPVNRRT